MKSSTSARSPLSPTLWPADAFRWWRSLLFALLLAAVVATTTIAMVLVLIPLHAFGPGRGASLAFTWPLVLGQLASYVPVVAVFAVFLPRLARRPLAALGLRRPQWSDAAWAAGGVVVMVAASAAAAAMQAFLFHVKAEEMQVELLRGTRGSLAVGVVFLACAAAPFVEELAFRGFLFNALLRYLPLSIAAVVSAVVFGAAHGGPGSNGAVFPLAAAGLVLALVYYRSGSLVASMLTHAAFNLVTVVQVLGFDRK